MKQFKLLLVAVIVSFSFTSCDKGSESEKSEKSEKTAEVSDESQPEAPNDGDEPANDGEPDAEALVKKTVDLMCKNAELNKEMTEAVEKASPEEKAKVEKEFKGKMLLVQMDMEEQIEKAGEAFKVKKGDEEYKKKVNAMMQSEMDKCEALDGMKVPQ